MIIAYNFSILNFPGATILDFMTSYGCRYCQQAEVLLCETIEQPYYDTKSKMAAPGKFRMKNRQSSNSVLSDTEVLLPCFPSKYEIRLYLQQFTCNVNLFKEWRFPLKHKWKIKYKQFSYFK